MWTHSIAGLVPSGRRPATLTAGTIPPPRRAPEPEPASRDEYELRIREVVAAENSGQGDLAAAAAQQQAAEAQRDAVAAQREAVQAQTAATAVQAKATKVALLAAVAAVLAVALSAVGTISTLRQNAQQERESRLSSALDALGSESPTAHISGLTLLVRNLDERVYATSNPYPFTEDPADAISLYATTASTVETYLKSRTELVAPGEDGEPRIGAGRTQTLPSAPYVVNQLRTLIRLGPEVVAIRARIGENPSVPRPGLDLSRAFLYRARLANLDFPDFAGGGHNFARADLRGADLTNSTWRGVSLTGAFMQCLSADSRTSFEASDLQNADLRGADLAGVSFRGAKLDGADLRGADIEGADLTDASTSGMLVDDAVGTPRGRVISPGSTAAAFDPDQPMCLARRELGREQGSPFPAPMAVRVPRFLIGTAR